MDLLLQFALFAGDNYYPSGGFHDFVDSFDTVDEAKAYLTAIYDWAEIIDLRTGQRVATWRKSQGSWVD